VRDTETSPQPGAENAGLREVSRWSSESEEDTQLQSTKHRKDNSAWGKRMEKELAAIERRAAEKAKHADSEGNEETAIEAESEDERPIVQTLHKAQPKFRLLSIGTEIMKQFHSGLFVGTVKGYDKTEDLLYKIEYSEGDREEYDKEEFIYAYQLALEHGDHDEETVEQIRQNDQWSSEEESAYVLPKVCRHCTHPSIPSQPNINELFINQENSKTW
jgi:hypothetical protein